jgi:hypothetical protein
MLFSGCSENPHLVDTSDINLDLELERFEQNLFKSKSVEDIKSLQESNPEFYGIYVNDIMPHQIRGIESTEEDIAIELYRYIAHPDMDSLYQLTQRKFGDFSEFQKELETACKYINYHFPEDHISQAITFISTFEFGSIYNESSKSFGIGLDMYMGRNFEIYKVLNPQNFPSYRVKRFESYHITPNCIKSYLNAKIPEANNSTFIEQAVYEGKKLYAMDVLLPNHQDSLKIGYLKGQLEWNIAQEANMWAYLIEKEILFSTDKNQYQQHFFNDGPFTTPFGNESSPRAGAWIGWQMVRSYMNKHSNLTLKDLLNEKDHHKIFKESAYRP